MTLADIFNGRDEATLIYRGDCTKRGYQDSSLFTSGQRFEFLTQGGAHSFIAEKVEVKPLARITADEFNKHVNGRAITPVAPSDLGPVTGSELCTVVTFKKDSYTPIPRSWMNQQPHRPN